MLERPDVWIWDSWIADDGETYHLFFLQAPKALGDPTRRHTAATIGLATSKDLLTWTYEGTALAPVPGGWDDLALWTGSVTRRDDGRWLMYYTAINTGGRHLRDQRLGVVESDDLRTWRRVTDQPVLQVDARWYKTLDDAPHLSETWRDPLVVRDPGGDGWAMYVCARATGAPRLQDGVLAHARSADLVTWELGPPVTQPSGFGQLEVPQVKEIDGQPILVFTCHPDEQSQWQRDEFGYFCTWYVLGESLTGPWDISTARPFRDEPFLFAAPLVQTRDGGWAFVGFRNQEPQGVLSFHIIDPVPVELRDGALVKRVD